MQYVISFLASWTVSFCIFGQDAQARYTDKQQVSSILALTCTFIFCSFPSVLCFLLRVTGRETRRRLPVELSNGGRERECCHYLQRKGDSELR